MAVWSVAGNVVTLTLDGSESGPFSRSHTFTAADGIEADQLHTFYLVVNPSVVPVHAFLEVVGGDITVATVSASQALRARGDSVGTDITVRFGVQDAEGSGSGGGTILDIDALAAIGDLVAAGFMLTSTGSGTRTADISGAIVDTGHASSLHFHIDHVAWVNGLIYYSIVVTGLAISTTYRVQSRVHTVGKPWFENVIFGQGGADLHYTVGGVSTDPNSQWVDIWTNNTTNASGELTFKIGMNASYGVNENWDTYFSDKVEVIGPGSGGAVIDFSDLTFCVGSGVGDGTGLGGGIPVDPNDPGGPVTPPNDPIPTPPSGGYPPPIVPGTRPFMCYNIPPGGLAYWNSTLSRFTPSNTENLINTARAAGCTLFFTAGSDSDWRDATGKFQFLLWKARLEMVLNTTRSRVALEEGIIDGTVFCHAPIDEPFVKNARWGGSILFSIVEQMVQYSKSLGAPFTTWPTMITGCPVRQSWWIVRHMNGLDWYSADYTLNFGDCATWVNAEIARAVALGHLFAPGLHYLDFDRPDDRHVRYPTPAEVVHYGTILSRSGTPFMRGWRWWEPMFSQSGFVPALKIFRDTYSSLD